MSGAIMEDDGHTSRYEVDSMTQQPNGSRVTMKDIATALGVSINTVHKALTGKPGVSDEVRSCILNLADELGYRRNAAASNLRRKGVRIAICLPSATGEGRYFHTYLWEGCRRYLDEARDSGIEAEFIEFEIGRYAPCLSRLVERVEAGDRPDGLLALAPAEGEETVLLRRITDAGVTLILLNGDRPQTGRVGAVVSDYESAGSLLAEQAENLLRFAEPGARLLLLSGDSSTDSHELVARAFRERVRLQRPDLIIDDIAGAHGQANELRRALLSTFETARPALAVSVFALGSEILADTIAELGLAGEVAALGSDLFPESISALRRGVFTNLVHKDPVGMAYRAIGDLCDAVLWHTLPTREVQTGSVELVFQSNLDQVCIRAGSNLL